MNYRVVRSLRLLFLALSLGALACDASSITSLFGGGDKPVVVIASPPSGSQFHEGEEIAVQSTSTDEKGVVRVELVADNLVVDVDASPAASGQSSFTLLQTWKATTGTHNLFVRAYNRTGIASDPVGISVTVLPGVALAGSPTGVATNVPTAPPATVPGSASPTATVPPPPCANNSTFVADVTVPDGTVLAANQSFNKIWRLSNPPGGCVWGSGYQFVFVSGSAMTASGAVAVPNTPAGGTADILVPMTAPGAPGNYSGSWRLKTASGALFGVTVSVKITVPGAPAENPPPPPASGCSGTPNAFSFTASSTTITAGHSTTLQWDAVNNADSFEIDHGIGGQAAPGSISVSPGSTTTYTATAHCGGNTRTAQVTITVNPGGPVLITRSSIGGSESGTVYEPSAGVAVVHGTMLAGDISANKIARSFMSFDISDISGKTIVSANLDLTSCTQFQNPFAGSLVGIWIGEVQYGLPLDQSDYGISGTGVLLLSAKPNSTVDVKSYVQTRVNESKTRFQIRLHPAGSSDNDGVSDYMSCGSGVPKLNITYQP